MIVIYNNGRLNILITDDYLLDAKKIETHFKTEFTNFDKIINFFNWFKKSCVYSNNYQNPSVMQQTILEIKRNDQNKSIIKSAQKSIAKFDKQISVLQSIRIEETKIIEKPKKPVTLPKKAPKPKPEAKPELKPKSKPKTKSTQKPKQEFKPTAANIDTPKTTQNEESYSKKLTRKKTETYQPKHAATKRKKKKLFSWRKK